MVAVWIAVELLFLFMFFSLPDIAEIPPVEASNNRGPSPIHHPINIPGEGTFLLPESKQHTNSLAARPQGHMKWSQRVWHLLREEPVVLLAVLFVTLFNQTGLEVSKFCPCCAASELCVN